MGELKKDGIIDWYERMKTPTAKGILVITGVIAGIVLARVMEPTGVGAERAARLFVSMFSITGGVVLGTVVLLGDPAILLQGSARLAHWQIKSIRRRLDQLMLLFISYIVTVALIIFSSIVSDIWPAGAHALVRVYVASGTAALIWSVSAPLLLLRIQRDRLDRELENRREDDKQATGFRAVQ